MFKVLHAELVQTVTKANATNALKLLQLQRWDGAGLQDDACIHLS